MQQFFTLFNFYAVMTFFANMTLLLSIFVLILVICIKLVSNQRVYTAEELEQHIALMQQQERERIARLLHFIYITEYPESLIVGNFVNTAKGRINRLPEEL